VRILRRSRRRTEKIGEINYNLKEEKGIRDAIGILRIISERT